MKLLEQLTTTPGVPGREHRVRELILRETQGLFDQTHIDALGTLIGTRHSRPRPRKAGRGRSHGQGRSGRPTRVMVAAHMDQIGFIVRHIDDKGFLRIAALGGFDVRNLFSRLVTVCTDAGDLPGVLTAGGKPTHIATEEDRRKIPEVIEMAIDLGLPADEVKAKVKIGDMVVINAPFTPIGRTVVAQALDNRVACWIAIRALQKLEHHNCEIHVAFTVQEEVGMRGAGPAAERIQPDIALVLDTTLCCDTPGVPDDLRITQQGAGVGINVLDSTAINDIDLLRRIEQVAREHHIKHQRTMLHRGGTDAGAIHARLAGTRTATLLCPTRYIHTVTEMVHRDDLDATRDLVAAYLTQL
jgi:endoglucanase